MGRKKKKRLGRVQIHLSYVVDLDDQNMVDEAKECLYEDLMSAYKYDEIGASIEMVEDKTLTENDIEDFLLEEEEDT